MSLFTRRAVPSDIDELLPLCRAFHAESPVHSQYAFDEDVVRRLLAATVNDTSWLLVVAIDDAGVAGMMMLYCMPMFFSTELEVGDLTFWVRPEKRGGRAAFLMMQQAIKWTIDKGAAKIQLGITTGINHDAAERFYAKWKFERTGIVMSWRARPPA